MRSTLAVGIFFSIVVLGTGVSLIPACTTPSAPEPEAMLAPEEQQKLNEYKAEVELGRNMAGRLLQFYGTYGDEDLISYVNQVGSYVANHSDDPARRYMFAILDTDAINAFACPGGYILVTLGTLRLARSEAELGMILGHEVAHVGKQHMFNTLKDMNKKDREEAAAQMDRQESLDPFALAVRRRPTTEDNAAGALVARYLSGSSGAGIGLMQAAKAGMNVILERGLDKELEFEADREGVRYAVRSGYTPTALLAFLTRLQGSKKRDKKQVDTQILEKTHPKISERAKGIRQILAELDAKEIVGAAGEQRYEKYLKSLPEPRKK